jgi:phosphoribosyl 1,2-cyclic phosphodiesterase
MKIAVTFWGCRGSLPRAFTMDEMHARLREALAGAGPEDIGSLAAADAYLARAGGPARYGGDTTCVELRNAAGGRLLIDFGSGARPAGRALAATAAQAPLDVLISHMHWDHVQGFPFFAPLFIPGATLRIHGGHGARALEAGLRAQFAQPHFPVPYDVTQARVSYHDCAPDAPFEAQGFTVTPHKLRHGGDSYGYRLEYDGVAVVFASDAEHDTADVRADHPYAQWIAGADLLIFDAQYSLADAVSIREDWGHSTAMIGVEYAHLAGVKALALTHHDPLSDDAMLDSMLTDARRLEALNRPEGAPPLRVEAAYEGMTLEIG